MIFHGIDYYPHAFVLQGGELAVDKSIYPIPVIDILGASFQLPGDRATVVMLQKLASELASELDKKEKGVVAS